MGEVGEVGREINAKTKWNESLAPITDFPFSPTKSHARRMIHLRTVSKIGANNGLVAFGTLG